MSTHICFASSGEASPSTDPVDERLLPQRWLASRVFGGAFALATA
ncbi:hypothetical protein [Agrobacterium sp. Azo12]|nr:hypothetical protein [Agrobacterium sp. Azo12]MDO5894045.1 hypothetical protein [Agrobacterium sp. Azo12]